MQILSGTWVVQVERHSIVLHLDDSSVKTAAVLTLQRNDITLVNMLRVEHTIYFEHLLLNVEHKVVVKLSVRVLAGNYEVERTALLQSLNSLFESRQRLTQIADKHKRMLSRTLLYQVLLLVVFVLYIQLVCNCDVIIF